MINTIKWDFSIQNHDSHSVSESHYYFIAYYIHITTYTNFDVLVNVLFRMSIRFDLPLNYKYQTGPDWSARLHISVYYT